MAIDMTRVIQAAAEAALEGRGSSSPPSKSSGKEKKRGLSVPRAFLIGAGIVTAGRLVVGSRGRDMLENLQERLIEFEHEHFDTFDGEEPEAEEDEDFQDEDLDEEDYDEPEAEDDLDEGDEEPEAEEGEEPEAEEDEDFDEEPDADEDEDFEEEDYDEEPEAEEDQDFEEEDGEPERPKRRRTRA